MSSKLVESDRMDYAIKKIFELGYSVAYGGKELVFEYNGNTITFYPYTGWATGKGIKDGRGLQNLLKQINNN